MSRLEFRAALDSPRPAAAWAMAGVAAATLWITRQLEPLAVVAQAAALGFSLRFRNDPRAWQRSPLLLNLGMFVVSSATVAVALRGATSLVALAHFAALAQALQLLDARPRRSEFLLVALALFQVILAANLTDSVLFVPLLAGFVIATTWTLIVHTLRAEALEAGVPQAAGRALTPGLLRTTLLASCGCFALAVVLFLLLPRLQGSVVRGVGLGPLAGSGFSDRVELGALGRIRQDPTVALRVETLAGRPPPPLDAYWRGLAFDRFDGRSWSVTPSRRWVVPGTAEVGVVLASGPADLEQRVVREPVASGVLFVAGEAHALQGTVRRLQHDANEGLYAPTQAAERVRYTVRSRTRARDDASLERDVAGPPAGEDAGRYLQLPRLREPVAELAARITTGQPSDAGRARALEQWLRRKGRYSDAPPRDTGPTQRTPVERFLFGDIAGHCEYFASAMVVLARASGLPSRLVNGFAGGRENRIGGFVELTRSDAHAWVEVHFARAGWVRYDPTPPDRRLRAALPPSLLERVAQIGSAFELWWFQRVVGFDRSDQLHAMKRAWLAWRRVRRVSHEPGRLEAWFERRPDRAGATAALGAGVVAGVVGLLLLRRRRRKPALPAGYDRALRLLARRGLVRPAACTAREFVRHARAMLPEEAAGAFQALTSAYLAQRFGGRSAADPTDLRRLRAALRRRRWAFDLPAWRRFPSRGPRP